MTVNTWMTADPYSFKERFELAHQDYREFLEGLIQQRLLNPQGNRGSDILLMFREKAEWPEKYREEVKVIGTEAPLRMLEKLKELGKRELEQEEQKALEAPAVEGEYREVPARMPEPVVKPPPQSEVPPGPQPRGSAKDRRAAQVKAAKGTRGKPARPVNRR
jgi:hypothetical protein